MPERTVDHATLRQEINWRASGLPGGWSGDFGVKVNVKGNGQECPFHMGVATLREQPRAAVPT